MAQSVLLIDDDEDDAVMIRDLLREVEGEKYEFHWESSYAAGRKAAFDRSYDVCIVDYRLGEKNGLELIQDLLKDGLRAPLILLTGFGDRVIDLEAMEAGAADYLVKGQITSQLLARSIRYSIKHASDLKILREREAHIVHQDRLASIGLLASGLAHEIGTPLGVIRGRAEYLTMFLDHPDQMKKGLEIIIGQIDRISKLIYSLLNLARREKSTEITDVKLGLVFEQVLSLLGHRLSKCQIEVDNQIPSDATVRAEFEPLEQVLLNLLVNAVHAIESAIQGGREKGHRITLGVKPVNGALQLSVSDTGCGITEANLGNLFKPFFTTKEVGVGTGLGLATCDRILRSWGGTIQVESKEGVGTTFRVLVPKA